MYGQWRSPTGNTTYRPSKDKLDQFNGIVNQVKSQYFGGDSGVVVFNFKKHFNGPDNAYHDYVCPPPHDCVLPIWVPWVIPICQSMEVPVVVQSLRAYMNCGPDA